ncbi:MAG: DUF1971 domain-containing protein [Nannocystaceae bacterium]|nr:DUF1971 domain-containing protein [Nannocystaceae bacterium]
MSRSLPSDAEAYRRTKVFTANTVPRGILAQHSTKAGTWGLIHVLVGEVQYFLEGESTPLASVEAGATFVVLPQEVHFVRLSADAEFLVEFHKRTGTASPQDPHR